MVARLVHHFKVDVPDQQYAVSNMATLTLKVATFYLYLPCCYLIWSLPYMAVSRYVYDRVEIHYHVRIRDRDFRGYHVVDLFNSKTFRPLLQLLEKAKTLQNVSTPEGLLQLLEKDL